MRERFTIQTDRHGTRAIQGPVLAVIVISVVWLLGACTSRLDRANSGDSLSVEAAQAAANAAPQDYGHWIALGRVYARVGRHPDAVQAFERAGSLAPTAGEPLRELCFEHDILKSWSAGASACAAALKADQAMAPNDPHAAVDENGLRFARLGLVARRKELEGKAAAISRDGPDRINFGMEFYHEGDFEQAVTVWSEVSAASPNYATARNDMASALIIMKKFEPARRALEEALRLDPGNLLFQNNRRWLEREMAAAK